eukprot:jgi/Ulvmu1/6270/UM028_0128.1
MRAFKAASVPALRSQYAKLSHRHTNTVQRHCVFHAGRRAYQPSRRRKVLPETRDDNSGGDALPQEVHELWQRFLGPNGSSIRQVHARVFYDNLDHGHVLGWAPHRPKKPPCYSEYVKMKRKHPDKLIAMQVGDFFEFAGWDTVMVIEALGLKGMGLGAISRDTPRTQPRAAPPGSAAAAVPSSQFADKVPRAGFPLRTGKVDVARLCHAGHQVAVVLQRRPEREGEPVTRYLAQVCTPHSPYCELAPAGNGLPTTAEEDRPVWGLQQSAQRPGQWTVHVWRRGALLRRSVEVGGQQEVLELLDASRGRAEWLALPVYFQSAAALCAAVAGGAAGGAGALGELRRNEAQLKAQFQRRFPEAPRIVQTINVLDAADFVAKVQDEHLSPPPVREDGTRSTQHAWRASCDAADQPLFLHESTARALGLKSRDVPDLTDSVLGRGALSAQRQKVRALLMRPPPPAVAADVSAAIREMLRLAVLPEFPILQSSNTIWARLQAGRACTADLHAVLRCVTATAQALQLPAAAPMMQHLLAVAAWTLGGASTADRATLLTRCEWVVGRLQPMLPQPRARSAVGEGSEEDEEAQRVQEEVRGCGLDVEAMPVNVEPLVAFFRVWEDKKVRELVNIEALPDAHAWMQKLTEARSRLMAVIAALVVEAATVHELHTGAEAGAAAAQLRKSTARNRLFRLVAVEGAQSLAVAGKWLLEVQKAEMAAEAGGDEPAAAFLRTAALRSARQPGTRREFVCDVLIEALDEYRETVRAMHDLAKEMLEEVCIELHSSEQHMATLQAAQQVNEWGSTLCQVAANAAAREWVLPELAGPEGELSIHGVWPYWMTRPERPASRDPDTDQSTCGTNGTTDSRAAELPGSQAVVNDVQLGQRIMLLTGANMSGKSTIMRSVMATALLGNVGLPMPCAGATVPEFRSFFYRCFDGDSPLAGLSGHAYECLQMQQLYSLAKPFAQAEAKHFMCVDELGKGTDDRSASALCCSALQLFDSSNFVGIFGTHQHDLFDERLGLLPLLRRCFCCHMHVEESAPPEDAVRDGLGSMPWLRCTFRLAPGVSTQSLAFQVAYEEGLDASLLQEAERMLKLLT